MLTTVPLTSIQMTNLNELDQRRLFMLQNGYDPFEKVLESLTDPITLDTSVVPYQIIDGRHRVYLARQKKYQFIKARLQRKH